MTRLKGGQADSLKQTQDKKMRKRKPSNEKKHTKKEKKAKKDQNKPKKPLTAFFVFMEDFRKEYKEGHPDIKPVCMVGKAAGEKWKSLTEAEKNTYKEKAAEKEAEYIKSMAAYYESKQNQGKAVEAAGESDKSESDKEEAEEAENEESMADCCNNKQEGHGEEVAKESDESKSEERAKEGNAKEVAEESDKSKLRPFPIFDQEALSALSLDAEVPPSASIFFNFDNAPINAGFDLHNLPPALDALDLDNLLGGTGWDLECVPQSSQGRSRVSAFGRSVRSRSPRADLDSMYNVGLDSEGRERRYQGSLSVSKGEVGPKTSPQTAIEGNQNDLSGRLARVEAMVADNKKKYDQLMEEMTMIRQAIQDSTRDTAAAAAGIAGVGQVVPLHLDKLSLGLSQLVNQLVHVSQHLSKMVPQHLVGEDRTVDAPPGGVAIDRTSAPVDPFLSSQWTARSSIHSRRTTATVDTLLSSGRRVRSSTHIWARKMPLRPVGKDPAMSRGRTRWNLEFVI